MSEERKRKARSVLKGFEDLYNDVDINFVLYLDADYYKKAKAAPADFEKLFRLTSSWKTTNMCCFDSNMNIVKYDTVGDILEHFYGQRLGMYEKRRQHQIAVLRDELEELEAKLAFVKAIVEGRLKILNEEDSVVLAGLKGLKLPPRSDREDPDTLGAYEYLLRMRIDKIKKSSVEAAVKDVEVTKQKIAVLEATTAKNIWSQELEEFLEAWKKMEAKTLGILSASSGVSGEKVVMKKKVIRKK